MKTFEDLEFKSREDFGFDSQAIMHFPNGWGLSVINGDFAYSYPGTYEVAILNNNVIDYSTEITDDVLGYQTPEEITEIMKELQGMKPKS